MLLFDVKVVPSSGRVQCKLEGEDLLKCFIKSPPERGKANEELIALIAKACGVTRDQVSIVSGATSRRKRLKIDADIAFDALLAALKVERQLRIE